MSTKDKRLRQLLDEPKVMEWEKVTAVLRNCGCVVLPSQKGSSHVKVLHTDSNRLLIMVRPHPSKDCKPYQIKKAANFLRELGYGKD